MKKPDKFQHKNKELEDKVNIVSDALWGNCLTAKGWWLMIGEYMRTFSPEEKQKVKQYIFEVMEDLEEQLEKDLDSLEEQYFSVDNSEKKE